MTIEQIKALFPIDRKVKYKGKVWKILAAKSEDTLEFSKPYGVNKASVVIENTKNVIIAQGGRVTELK